MGTIAYSASNRIGCFRIRKELLQSGPDRPKFKAIFDLCTLLHHEPDDTGRGVMFTCASDLLFEPLAEGETIPEYRIEAAWPDQKFDNPEHELSCVKSGNFRIKAIRKIIIQVPTAAVGLSAKEINKALH